MRKQDTFSLFFSGLFTLLLHLFEILSVARFPHCFLFHLPLLQNVLLNLRGKVRSIIGMKEQSVETPWEMKQERLRALYFLFCNLIILDFFLHLCTAWQIGVGFCMLFTVILHLYHTLQIRNSKFTLYWLQIMRLNNGPNVRVIHIINGSIAVSSSTWLLMYTRSAGLCLLLYYMHAWLQWLHGCSAHTSNWVTWVPCPSLFWVSVRESVWELLSSADRPEPSFSCCLGPRPFPQCPANSFCSICWERKECAATTPEEAEYCSTWAAESMS